MFAIIINAPPSKAPIPTAPVGAPAVEAVETPLPFAVEVGVPVEDAPAWVLVVEFVGALELDGMRTLQLLACFP